MNTKDAAAFLAITERTLIRYANAGRIKATKVKGKTGLISDYALLDLERLKRELDPTYEGPTEGDVVEEETSSDNEMSEHLSQSGQQLAIISPQAMTAPTMLTSSEKALSDVFLLSVKKLLSLEEAATLTGLSTKRLRDAIKEGSLKAGRVGRSFKIRPSDLDDYLSGLF